MSEFDLSELVNGFKKLNGLNKLVFVLLVLINFVFDFIRIIGLLMLFAVLPTMVFVYGYSQSIFGVVFEKGLTETGLVYWESVLGLFSPVFVLFFAGMLLAFEVSDRFPWVFPDYLKRKLKEGKENE